jgi:hypothetical protein
MHMVWHHTVTVDGDGVTARQILQNPHDRYREFGPLEDWLAVFDR